ncbi:hypothetical protein D6C86_06035 [Aureobasidium pullulans]|uniref:Uncharacterized protein n=1 Tax=Aureobasidium pullulans TaxID=5580 RepID=A0A4S9W1Z6_AURPU|nr:hypothetical protein D6C94_06578 [Aureobasidium pullulans]THZ59012.1 hypothetical protein D6C86_06035 [Aureobasidium pullulans]
MKDPTSSPSPVKRGASTKSSVWSASSVARSATVAMANISSSVELITSNTHVAMSVAAPRQEMIVVVICWTCHSAGWRSNASLPPTTTTTATTTRRRTTSTAATATLITTVVGVFEFDAVPAVIATLEPSDIRTPACSHYSARCRLGCMLSLLETNVSCA